MKKILCFVLLICVLLSTAIVSNAVEDQGLYDAYLNALSNYNYSADYSRYTVYDIDKDGIPELIVQSRDYNVLNVYTYKNQTIQCYEDDANAYYDGFFEYGGNGILVYYGGMGKDHLEYMDVVSFENDKFFIANSFGPAFSLDALTSLLEQANLPCKRLECMNTNDASLLTPLKPISVMVNGSKVDFDTVPVNKDGRVMVPIRAIAEKMGYEVKWNPTSRAIILTGPEKTVVFRVDNNSAIVITDPAPENWTFYDMDVAPQIISDRTLTPVRAIAECLGATVTWEGASKTVYITY